MKIDSKPSIIETSVAITATVGFIQEAHAGQKYGSMPYFFHPVEVSQVAVDLANALNMAEEIKLHVTLAALLHDIIEDTPYTEEQLRKRYSDPVVDAVVLLTKDDALDYRANIQRIIDSGDVVAMVVKLADNKVNRGGDKSYMTVERVEKLNTRYDMSIEMLTNGLRQRGFSI